MGFVDVRIGDPVDTFGGASGEANARAFESVRDQVADSADKDNEPDPPKRPDGQRQQVGQRIGRPEEADQTKRQEQRCGQRPDPLMRPKIDRSAPYPKRNE